MFGQGKDLAAASDSFTRALPITPELTTAAEEVLSAIEGEIELLQNQITKFQDSDPNPSTTDIVIATRQGALMALTAERSRWRKIVNALREVPARPADPTGYAYFEGNPPPEPR